MYSDEQKYKNKLAILKEREKELKCLYKVEEIINEGLCSIAVWTKSITEEVIIGIEKR